MRKDMIFTPVLPKTLQDFLNRQRQKEGILNLEKNFLLGRQENKLSKLNYTINTQRLKNIRSKISQHYSTPRQSDYVSSFCNEQMNLQSTDENNQATTRDKDYHQDQLSQKFELSFSDQQQSEQIQEFDSSNESVFNPISNQVRQINVDKEANHFWSIDYQKELKKNIAIQKEKWEKMEKEDESYHQLRKREETSRGYLSWMTEKEGVICIDSVMMIGKEYSKPYELCNFYEIDKILQKLRFFHRFPKGVRIGILENCQFVKYQKNEIIFNQNDEGSDMYILIRGSVLIKQRVRNQMGIIYDYIVTSLYDGNQFGDQSMTENGKRNVTAISAEESHTLVMQRQRYEQVLIKAIEKDMESKIRILRCVKFLKICLTVTLIPLAAVLQTKIYQMGEHLYKQEQEIPFLIFITRGSCDVVYEKRAWRETTNLLIPEQRTRFLFKEQKDPESNYPKKPQEEFHYIKEPLSRSFDHSNKRRINQRVMEMTEHILINQLKNGDVIGGRTIFTSDKLDLKRRANPNFEKIYGKNILISKLSVIASSANVETFTLDLKQFNTLPESLQNQIRIGLSQEPEYDEISIQDVMEQDKNWNVIKQGYYKSLIKCKQNKKALYYF